ncbi:spherulation-specific family 4 protein [Luedemannella flava]|uniref:Spherulation-specific family 4 protein n=1 Tax=Luedemannella flava TaxID=349316 RepID=A0ABP4Z0J9_9ACTN
MIPAGRRLAVPAYFHPAVARDDWVTLAEHAGRLRAVVLNIADGPGAAPEPVLGAAIRAVAERGGTVLGYVDTAYGERSPAAVRADAERYRAWYPVAGLFLDRVVTAADRLVAHGRVVAAARAGAPGTLVANHGTWPAPAYADLADALVTFEGTAAAHAGAPSPAWAYGLPAARFWHLVYDVPADGLAGVLRRAVAGNVATVLATDRAGANPWNGLPSYFTHAIEAWEPHRDAAAR